MGTCELEEAFVKGI